MINVGKLIDDVELYCDDIMNGNVALGMRVECLDDAVKVIKMWEWFKDLQGNAFVTDLVTQAEEKFFPFLITQTVTIEIQGRNEQRLRNTISTIECVEGVKDVRPHESRY